MQNDLQFTVSPFGPEDFGYPDLLKMPVALEVKRGTAPKRRLDEVEIRPCQRLVVR